MSKYDSQFCITIFNLLICTLRKRDVILGIEMSLSTFGGKTDGGLVNAFWCALKDVNFLKAFRTDGLTFLAQWDQTHISSWDVPECSLSSFSIYEVCTYVLPLNGSNVCIASTLVISWVKNENRLNGISLNLTGPRSKTASFPESELSFLSSITGFWTLGLPRVSFFADDIAL